MRFRPPSLHLTRSIWRLLVVLIVAVVLAGVLAEHPAAHAQEPPIGSLAESAPTRVLLPQPVIPAAGMPEARVPQTANLPASEFYGINFIQPFEPWLSIGKESGAGIVRWQFNWRDAEVSPGIYSWVGMDQYITAWENAGYKIDAILHNPPDWAKRNANGLVPTNFELAWNDPKNGWGQFCYRFAQRYKGRIDSYEIWNEPDLDFYWEASAEEYYQLMKTCYQAIKAADSNPPVAMAGMVLLADRNFFPIVVRLAAQDPQGPANNYFFDVANIHMYADPSHVYNLTVSARRTLNTYGLGHKPIWITETNIALHGHGDFPNPDWGHVSEEEQGWYILQAAVNAHAAGVERLMYFRLADDGMNESFGLVNQTGTPRASYNALKLATSILYNITEVRREVRSGVNIAYFRRSDGTRIVALYSEAGTGLHVQIEAGQQGAIMVSSAGGYTPIKAEEGSYIVPIPPARNRNFAQGHAVGGPMVFIIEQDTEAPTVTASVDPVEGDRTKVLLHWTGYDGFSGTGIVSYEVIVSVNGGPWESWQAGITDTQVLFDISKGGTYEFQVRAIDRVGNIGPFSQSVSTSLVPEGTLQMQIADLRGQAVPFARVTLADGTLHDADANGTITITAAPGMVRVASIDGSGQGRLEPDQPFEIALAETSISKWMLMPLENLIRNGQFDFAEQGWKWSAPGDVSTVQGPGTWGTVLQIHGNRRPWGMPHALVELDVPQSWTGAVLSFNFRTPEPGTTLRVRAISETGHETLWHSESQIGVFERIWVDMSEYAGQHITLHFELVAEKHGTPQMAEIDDVIFGNVPPR